MRVYYEFPVRVPFVPAATSPHIVVSAIAPFAVRLTSKGIAPGKNICSHWV